MGLFLLLALLFYSIGVFSLLFSIYLQSALHQSVLRAGLIFLPFGVGFLLGPLSTPFGRRIAGPYVNPIGMGLETLGLLGFAGLMMTTADGIPPAAAPLSAALFIIGFGQGLALPTLQLSTALSVAIIGGIFYAVLGSRGDPGAITHAFIVAVLCIACCLAAGAGLSISLARKSAAALKLRKSNA
ncbi:hypothetical protein PFH44_15045 [Raoultella sp. Ech2A]|uniref:hypothetical protein n=1 Tax=Raoultella sp. Ech2A TaxID=2996539 RepID=UPI0024BFF9F7|nr:hypothetical protein [Raoultella sp. Ech2A]MDJ1654791.1 hypothetical protein [Raoultella sp. Ech2A]